MKFWVKDIWTKWFKRLCSSASWFSDARFVYKQVPIFGICLSKGLYSNVSYTQRFLEVKKARLGNKIRSNLVM